MRTQGAFALLEGAKEIRVALVAAGPRITDLLTEQYPPPVVDGEPLFDYGKQVQHLIHGLETAASEVVVAEDAHMKQEVKVSRLRTERDLKANDNHNKLVAVRQGFDGMHGDKGSFEAAFVKGTVPRNAKRLVGQLEQSVTLLNDPAVAPRTFKVAGFNVEYSVVASDLESGRLDLKGTVDELDEKLKIAEGTMLARRQAIDELRRTVIWAGRSAEGLFERAGENELAKRIRSSVRRPLRPSEEKATAEQQAVGKPPATGEAPSESDSGSAPSESGSGSSEPQPSDA